MSQLKNIKLSTPTYREIVPSNKKEIKIKPFKVGDEKVLLIAVESDDTKQIVDSLKRVVDNCVDGEEVENLSSYDLEYLFLKIRSKSVGETSKINVKCPSCDTANEFTVDLQQLEVRGLENFNTTIKINDELVFEMSQPKIDFFVDLDSGIESIMNYIVKSVKTVYYGEEVIEITDADHEDIQNIIEQLTSEQFSKIQDYVTSIPKVSYDVNYTCKHCSTETNTVLEGMSDFF